METDKRSKIKFIIVQGCGGCWASSQELLDRLVDIIYEKLKDVPNNYHELLSAYIRL